MIRCRQCNTELTEQAHFCKTCGLPKNPPEPKLEISTLIEQQKSDTNRTNLCGNCATELPKEARFCGVCGAVQTRTPGLIRPVTPKSTTRSVIPSRTDSAGPTKSIQQSIQIPQAPAFTKQQSQQSPSSSYLQPDVRSQDKQQNDIAYSPTMDLPISASFMATSKAAEQWRKSWRDRQYAEAGPAENVSRGQASVPMPLMTMQRSFASMRAFEKNDKKQQVKRSVNFFTRIIFFLIICLILSLGVYIILSYLLHSAFGVTNLTSPTNTTQPTMAVIGTASQTVKIGQTIQLHGEHFGADQSIILLRDTATLFR